MSIWFEKTPDTLARLNSARSAKTVLHVLDIKVTEIGDEFVRLTMPVDDRHVQPMGILHGGVSLVLAESAASIAAMLCLDPNRQFPVGMEINANHLRQVPIGETITATASPIHLGRSSHVWRVALHNSAGKPVCEARMTARILDRADR